MLYGGYSRGSSQENSTRFPHTNDTPFPQRSLKPETLDALELGLKSGVLDHSLCSNGALFSISGRTSRSSMSRERPGVQQSAEMQIYGAELEGAWVPAAHWKADGSIGLSTRKSGMSRGLISTFRWAPGHATSRKATSCHCPAAEPERFLLRTSSALR